MRYARKVALGAILVGLVWAGAACTDGLTDINENPNAPTDVPVEFLMPQAIQVSIQNTFGAGQMLQHTGIWPQHFVQLQYPDEETGQVRASRMDGYWQGYFIGPLKDLQTIIAKAQEEGHPNAEATAKIMKEWSFHIMTDLWGDIPYSEALDGETNATPVYDAQSDIYSGMLANLGAAAGMLAPAGRDLGGGDILYGNDFDAWRKFANSLRMRLAMRLSEVSPSTAQAEFVSAFNAGGFTSNADNAMLQYPGAPYENPLYENYLGRDDNGISATMVDMLKAYNDPRLALYAEPATHDGEYRGHQNGRDDLPTGQSLAWFSRIGNFWRANGANTPSAVMTYSEVLFLQAEAAERGWISGDPEALYLAAIEANMNQYDDQGVGPTDAEIAAYLAQPEVAYAGLESIYMQKWISLFGNGSEAFAEWRRTDYPSLEAGPDLILSRIPVRFSYPDTEQSLNKANLDAAVARQGGGLDLVTPVWWDVM